MAHTFSPPQARIGDILKTLGRAYPHATCSLTYSNPLQLLVATMLSAQCTDVLVNKVTVDLFKKYKAARDYANAPLAQLEQDVSRVNFYRNKAKHIKLSCQMIVEKFGGSVPNRMEDLIELPGVARKTANVVLGNAYSIQAGVVVDTHVMRLAQRMGLSAYTDRDKIEQDLMKLVPPAQWTVFGHRMIAHGRAVCKAKHPLCQECPLGKDLCPSYTVS